MFRCFSCLLMVQLSLLINIGCGESPTGVDNDAQPHDHDESHHESQGDSLEAAISQVTSLRNTIRDSFAIDDVDTAHGPLHEVGDALLLIPELAKKQGVSAESQSAIEAEVNTLMDAFGNVDKTLHGQEGSTYEEESETIDAAITALCSACGISPDASAMLPETQAPTIDNTDADSIIQATEVAN